MQEPNSPLQSGRQRSSIESFLDDYQAVRLYLSLAALAVVVVFYVSGWSRDQSPIPSLVVLLSMSGHAAWCRFRHIRAPMTMLTMDITLLGVIMFTLTDTPSTMLGIFAFLALVVVLFADARWMAGFLLYLTGWYLAASLVGIGFSFERIGELIGNVFAIGALVAVMIRVRRWLGRLEADRSQMIGTVSHELRNNLTGVMGLTEVVSTMADLEPAEAKELVLMAHQQAVDASDIVEDLLIAATLEAAALTVNHTEVNVNTEVLTVAGRFHEEDHEIGLALAEDLEPAWADALRLRQVVRNLLSNAIRYGGPVATVITRSLNHSIEIVVRDNGDGVPEEDVATIFLPYRRSTRGPRHASSIGLGLWISRNLVQAMGGKLEYRRTDGLTEFIISIPTAGADQPQASAEAFNPARRQQPASEQPGFIEAVRFAQPTPLG
jgi:signal transduction histidine kinase